MNDNIKVGICGCKHRCAPPTTYKTIILKPNCVCGHNTLTQEMVSSTNTKYVIKYDFDLGDEDIIIPANCILEFDGGNLNNGILKLSSNNKIIGGTLFHIHINASGTENNRLHDIWIENCLLTDDYTPRELNLLYVNYVDNFTLKDVTADHWKGDSNPDTDYHTVGTLLNSTNIVFENVKLLGNYPEGLDMLKCDTIHIYDSIFDTTSAQGPAWTPFNMEYCSNVYIYNSIFKTRADVSTFNVLANNLEVYNCSFIGGKGIDIGEETSDRHRIDNFERKNNLFKDCTIKCTYGFYSATDYIDSEIENLVIDGCTITCPDMTAVYMIGAVRGELTFINNEVIDCARALYLKNSTSDVNVTISNNAISLGANGGAMVSLESYIVGACVLYFANNTITHNNSIQSIFVEHMNGNGNVFIKNNEMYIKSKDIYLVRCGEGIISDITDNVFKYIGNESCKLHGSWTNTKEHIMQNNIFEDINIDYSNNEHLAIFKGNIIRCTREEYLTVLIGWTTYGNLIMMDNTKIGDVRVWLGTGTPTLFGQFIYNNNNFTPLSGGYTIGTVNYILASHSLYNVMKTNTFIIQDGNVDLSGYENGFLVYDRRNGQQTLAYKEANRLVRCDGYASARVYGLSSQRPIGIAADGDLSNTDKGYMYFDEDLIRPVFAQQINMTTGDVYWKTADGASADAKRSGLWSERPLHGYTIYNGFCYFLIDETDADPANHKHFPIWAHIQEGGDNIKWYKADGTEYTGA